MIDLKTSTMQGTDGRSFYSVCWRLLARASRLLLVLTFLGIPLYSQDPEGLDSSPPPPKLLSKEESSQLSAVTDVKKRTKLALEMMEARVKRAEAFNKGGQLDEMFAQLGGFHALVDDTLDYLTASNKDSRKVQDNFKRFEIAIRKFVPRLEVLRRDMPLKYEFYVRRLMIYLRDARAKAVEPLFSDTVVPGTKPQDHQ